MHHHPTHGDEYTRGLPSNNGPPDRLDPELGHLIEIVRRGYRVIVIETDPVPVPRGATQGWVVGDAGLGTFADATRDPGVVVERWAPGRAGGGVWPYGRGLNVYVGTISLPADCRVAFRGPPAHAETAEQHLHNLLVQAAQMVAVGDIERHIAVFAGLAMAVMTGIPAAHLRQELCRTRLHWLD